MALRTLYLQSRFSINGRDAFRGRVLFDRFCQLSEETLLGHVVRHNEKADAQLTPDVVSYALLRDFQPNVVFIEGGLLADDADTWKLPEDIATEVCKTGGVVIVADVDANLLHKHKADYLNAGRFFHSIAWYKGDSDYPVYGLDDTHFWSTGRQILCDPAKMLIHEWVRPIYEGVPEILVSLPVCLESWDSLVASCNCDTTATLHQDCWVDRRDACPFASAHQIENGFAVLIAGRVSGDTWLEGCPHNPVWLTNLAAFLVDEASEESARRKSHRHSPHLLFLSHRSTDRTTVREVATAIRGRGVNVWFDEERLVPSDSLTAEIDHALGQMTHFVLFWSSSCVAAPWVDRELNAASTRLINEQIPLIVVRLDETPVPPIIADLVRIEAPHFKSDAIGSRIVEAVERRAHRTET